MAGEAEGIAMFQFLFYEEYQERTAEAERRATLRAERGTAVVPHRSGRSSRRSREAYPARRRAARARRPWGVPGELTRPWPS